MPNWSELRASAAHKWRVATEVGARVFYYAIIAAMLLGAIVALIGVIFLASHDPEGTPANQAFFNTISKYFYVTLGWILDSGQSFTIDDRRLVDQLTNAAIFLLTFAAIVFSTFYIFKERNSLLFRAPYRDTPFKASSQSMNAKALPIMASYYGNANRISVISGDYDWLLTPGSSISETVLRLVREGKAQLKSYKKKEEVAAVWGHANVEKFKEIFEEITFEHPTRLKASLLEYRDSKSLVFLADVRDARPIKGSDPQRSYSIYEYPNYGAARPIVAMAELLFETTSPTVKRTRSASL